MILVASVMHTGTHLMMHLLEDHQTFQCHFKNVHTGRLVHALRRAKLTVIPLRHPARCLASFRSRNRKYNFFTEQWDNMLKHNLDAHYIHIDDPDRRDEDIANIPLNLGTVDWRPSITTGMKMHNHNLVITDEMLAEIPQQYIDFYNRHKKG